MSGRAGIGRVDLLRPLGRCLRWLAQWLVGYAVGLVTLPVRFLLWAPLVVVGRSWHARHFGALSAYMLGITAWLVAYWAGFAPADLPDWAALLVFGPGAVLVLSVFIWVFPTRSRALENPAPGLWSYAPGYIPSGRPSWWKARYNVLPETDLIRLGVAWITRVDPWMSRAEARTIRRVMGDLLAEMDADRSYRELAPIWWAVERTVLPPRWPPLLWHQFAYFPPAAPDRQLGTLIFLHGHGPNLALYLHAWRRFCDENRVGIVCPSFGYGNWEHPDAVEPVRWVLEQAAEEPLFDPARVYLAGISQGGCGVGRAGAALADRFAGLVFISPTMEPDVLGSTEFVAGWKGRPVLVIQGGRDHNVKPATVDAAVEQLRANGAAVTYHRDPEADHFLFFAQLDEMHRRIGEWMTGAAATAS